MQAVPLLAFADGRRLSMPCRVGRAQIRSAVVAKEAVLIEPVSAATDPGAAAFAASAPGIVPVARITRVGAGPIAVVRTGALKGYIQLGVEPLYLCEGDEVLVSPASAGAAGHVRIMRGAPPAPAPPPDAPPRGRGRPKGSIGIKKRVRNEFGVLVPRESLEGGGASSLSGASAGGGGGGGSAAAPPPGLRSIPSGGISSRRLSGEGPAAVAPAAAPPPLPAAAPPAHPPAAGPPPPPVLLLLVGLPGSGKSHFAQSLLARCPPGTWTRVNQDSAGPRPGSAGRRATCVAATAAALAGPRRSSVVVDRCNLDAGQRADFVAAAAAANVPVHAVVLDLPTKACGERAAGREAHEGGLQGPRARAVVGRMAATFAEAGMPTTGPPEGLASVMVCKNDAEAAAAVATWAARSGGGTSGGAPPPPLVAGGRPAAEAGAVGGAPTPAGPPLSPGSPLGPPRPSAFAALSTGPPRMSSGVLGASGVTAGPGTAALPAAATAVTTAATTAGGAVAAAPSVSSPPSEGGAGGGGGGGGGGPIPAATTTTTTAKPAAAPAAAPAEEAPTPTPVGDAPPIRKPSDLPAPPPAKCGAGGPGAYRPALPPRKKGKVTAAPAAGPPPPPSAAGVAGQLASAIQAATAQEEEEQRRQAAAAAGRAPARSPPPRHLPPGWPVPPPSRAPRGLQAGHPVHALWSIAADPGAHAAAGVQLVLPPPSAETGNWAPTPPAAGLVIAPDKFPKAAVHGLVLVHGPDPPPTPFHLGPGDAPLVRAMAVAGRAWLAARGVPPAARLVGFHSSPSLQPLHLHALSSDLRGPSMRTKKHYLSFKRPFFVPADVVAEALEAGRPPPLLSSEAAAAALRADLACDWCGAPAASIQPLQEHQDACAVAHGAAAPWFVR